MSQPSPSSLFAGQAATTLRLPDGSSATVLHHGAQVVSWRTSDGVEQLYCSPLSCFEAGMAVRGGVPVIFPQFEQMGPDASLPRHGLVRQRPWQLQGLRDDPDHAQATFTLTDDEATRALWPHGFELELTVALSPDRLDIELHVVNRGDSAWAFSAALHTYVRAHDLSQLRLQGLQGCTLLDRTTDTDEEEGSAERGISGEVDALYIQAPDTLDLSDGPRALRLQKEGFADWVLWNPGATKARALNDLPDADWRAFVCLEAAQVKRPPRLAPGDTWTGRQSLWLHRTPD